MVQRSICVKCILTIAGHEDDEFGRDLHIDVLGVLNIIFLCADQIACGRRTVWIGKQQQHQQQCYSRQHNNHNRTPWTEQ